MKEDIRNKIESKIKAKRDSKDKRFDMGGGKHSRECGVVLFSLPPGKMLVPGDNLTICSRTSSLCHEVGRRGNREEQLSRGGSSVAPALIDGTIWQKREAGSLMSLGIDEDKTGMGSRSNNLWGFILLLMGGVRGSVCFDGRLPCLLSCSCMQHSAAGEERKALSWFKGRNRQD